MEEQKGEFHTVQTEHIRFVQNKAGLESLQSSLYAHPPYVCQLYLNAHLSYPLGCWAWKSWCFQTVSAGEDSWESLGQQGDQTS